MSSLATRISDLAAAVAGDFKVQRRRVALSTMRSGAIAESCDRRYLNDAAGAFSATTGQTRWVAIHLEAGDVINTITIPVGQTAAVTPTHHYAMLATSGGVILKVSADRTTTAIPANAEISYTLISSYTAPTTGLYYVGWNVTAATTPTCCNFASQWPMLSVPLLAGLTTGNSTPPAVAATLVLNNNQRIMYCWVS